MTSLEPLPGRRRERILGSLVVLVGVAVLVLSVVALVGARSRNSSDVGVGVVLPSDSASDSSTAPSGTATGATPTGSAATGGPASTGSPSAGSSDASTGGTSTGGSTAGTLPLVVLNNTRTTGLAQQAQADFQRGGWTVTSTGNLTQDILSTCAYYDPDVDGAQQAAEALMSQFPAVKRVKEKFGGLPAGPIVVVLTSDYTAG